MPVHRGIAGWLARGVLGGRRNARPLNVDKRHEEEYGMNRVRSATPNLIKARRKHEQEAARQATVFAKYLAIGETRRKRSEATPDQVPEAIEGQPGGKAVHPEKEENVNGNTMDRYNNRPTDGYRSYGVVRRSYVNVSAKRNAARPTYPRPHDHRCGIRIFRS